MFAVKNQTDGTQALVEVFMRIQLLRLLMNPAKVRKINLTMTHIKDSQSQGCEWRHESHPAYAMRLVGIEWPQTHPSGRHSNGMVPVSEGSRRTKSPDPSVAVLRPNVP